MGRKQLSNELKTSIGENKIDFNLPSLAQGVYILKIFDSNKAYSAQLFNVVK
jgi:hypothetical protein